MRSMFVAIVALAVLGNVNAFAGSYQDAMKTCGAEWKASEQRKAVKKGEGAAAWNAFRAECTKRIGWEKKTRGSAATK